MAIATSDPVNEAERRIRERRAGEAQLATTIVISKPPHRDRRIAHTFQRREDPAESADEDRPCETCGYGAPSHLALTHPEQEVVTTLLNQRQAPTLMRRSILRKLTSTILGR